MISFLSSKYSAFQVLTVLSVDSNYINSPLKQLLPAFLLVLLYIKLEVSELENVKSIYTILLHLKRQVTVLGIRSHNL
jgi:hypothetical protein